MKLRKNTISGYSKYIIYENGTIVSLWKLKPKRLRHVIDGGYPIVTLIGDDGSRRNHLIHRLLCIAFVPNPENKPFINHIDGIKSNYKLSNLEWCTPKENAQHAVRIGLCDSSSCYKVIHKYSMDGEYLCTYSSISEACKDTGAYQSNIYKVAKGLRPHAMGFKWQY